MHTTLTNCTTLYKDEDGETFRNDEQGQTLVYFLQEETIQLNNADGTSPGSNSHLTIEENIIMNHNKDMGDTQEVTLEENQEPG